MSNPNTFINTYAGKVQQFVELIQDLRSMNDWLDQDSTMLDRYFAQSANGREVPRTDIVKADVTAAHDAINQVIFAYDSGSPAQKAKILKMLP